MEHLVESHLGGYYISDMDSKIITATCDTCGGSDWIILSWDKGHMMQALISYFSRVKHFAENIDKDREAGITKKEAIESILFEYFNDKNIIETLYEERIILEEDYKRLLKENLQAQKRQISLVCEVYPKEVRKKLKKK